MGRVHDNSFFMGIFRHQLDDELNRRRCHHQKNSEIEAKKNDEEKWPDMRRIEGPF